MFAFFIVLMFSYSLTAIGEASMLLLSDPMIVILMWEATTVVGNSMMLLKGIPASNIALKFSQLLAASIRTLVTTRLFTLPKVSGVPILTRVTLAVPPKLKIRYSGHPGPSRNAGDQA